MAETPKNDARQLRELNFDLANYFSNTIIPQLFVDADLILRIFTPRAMDQFNLTYEHIGKNIADVKDNLRYPNVVEDIQGIIDSTDESLHKEVQTTDGRWFEMNIVPYVELEEDFINGVIITFVDITKRLRAVRDLEKLNSQHETLLFALSHDLRQPISAMTLIADGLLMAHQKGDSAQFEKLIKILKQSSKSLKIMVDDFTSNNTEENGKTYDEAKLSIREICNDILTALKTEIRARKITITTDLKVAEIRFPKNNLRSIVYNLIHNAIKFSDPEKASEIKITSEKVEDYIIFCVVDNGVGIPEEHQRYIFKKSSRLSENISGTGMGLYVVKTMIEDNNGRIRLQSKEGLGSTFSVFFKQKPG